MSSLLLLKTMLFAKATKTQNKRSQFLQKKSKLVKKTTKIIKKIPIKNKIYDVMCRICDQEEGNIPIFDNFVQPNIPEEILHFTGVTIEKSDGLSKHMCQNCLHLLNGCIMFKEICQKTNKKLMEMAIKKESNLEPNTNYDDFSEQERNGDSNDFFDEYSEHKQNHFDLAPLSSHLKKFKGKKVKPKLEKSSEEPDKKRFLCDVCGKTACSNANLLSHLLIHEPKFPFKCEQCPYMGRTRDLLKVHVRSHLSEKPFKCPQCPKATTTASNLAKHVRHVHSSNKPYKCSYCEKPFSFQHDVKRHIKDIHLRQGTVECYVCLKKFSTRKILRGHQWKVHKIKGERQGRLPSYLQWQMDEQNENHKNIGDSEKKSEFLT